MFNLIEIFEKLGEDNLGLHLSSGEIEENGYFLKLKRLLKRNHSHDKYDFGITTILLCYIK